MPAQKRKRSSDQPSPHLATSSDRHSAKRLARAQTSAKLDGTHDLEIQLQAKQPKTLRVPLRSFADLWVAFGWSREPPEGIPSATSPLEEKVRWESNEKSWGVVTQAIVDTCTYLSGFLYSGNRPELLREVSRRVTVLANDLVAKRDNEDEASLLDEQHHDGSTAHKSSESVFNDPSLWISKRRSTNLFNTLVQVSNAAREGSFEKRIAAALLSETVPAEALEKLATNGILQLDEPLREVASADMYALLEGQPLLEIPQNLKTSKMRVTIFK